jgi:hypothetical protein
MTSLNQLNYTVGEAVPVEGILKVASDDVLRKAVTITLNSTDFEMSETKTGSTTTFAPVSSVTYAEGIELFLKPIYVRLKSGLDVSKKTGTITITHDGQAPIIVNLTGEVKPLQVNSTVAELIDLNYLFGKGPSAEKSFTVSGNVNDNLVVTAPTNYEISTSAASGYTASISLPKSQGGNVANKLIYVRLKAGLEKAIYNETIAISATNAATVNVSLKGAVQ